jgi:hypothetical protein
MAFKLTTATIDEIGGLLASGAGELSPSTYSIFARFDDAIAFLGADNAERGPVPGRPPSVPTTGGPSLSSPGP